MALADCYMVKDFQELDGEELLNLYFYQDIVLGSTAELVHDAWIAGVLPKLLDVQCIPLIHRRVQVVNLADLDNFFESAPDEPGLNGEDFMPAHNAINFTLRLNTRAIRPGSRRIAGLSEANVQDGVLVGSTFLGQVEDLRSQFDDTLLSGVDPAYVPVVIKRVLYHPEGSPDGHMAYRLPVSDEELVVGNVTVCLVNTKVSHQTSRGNGR